MQFFDLNLPYLEGSASVRTLNDNPMKKKNRLKMVVKAMELGYSGVAYNFVMKGVMSESDRCSISLFPLLSLLKISPSISSTASFHRRLLGASVDSPFRQYTRLTVLVETSGQASALNSGNPILKTYDLVAVRPLNQNAFEQVCQFSEVDLIAIDFSEKLPFRLKLPTVKAAIARGIYFEITYSGLIECVQVRRQVISNAKLLVEWTRGKNLIISSAAPSVLELRGPNDVANLLSLLGLPIKRAKAASAHSCRSLITNALRKKQFHKEAIKVEMMPSLARSEPKEPWILDWMEWDPISSEGDLLFDDMAKSFSNISAVCKPFEAIDFASIVDSKPSFGFQVKDLTFRTEDKTENPDNLVSSAEKLMEPREPEKVTFSTEKRSMFYSTPIDHQICKSENCAKFSVQNSSKDFARLAGIGIYSTTPEKEVKNSDGSVANISPVGACNLQLQDMISTCEADMSDCLLEKATSRDVDELSVSHNAYSNLEVSAQSKDLNLPAFHDVGSIILDNDHAASGAQRSMEVQVSTRTDLIDRSDHSLVTPDLPFGEDILEGEGNQKYDNKAAIDADSMMHIGLKDKWKGDVNLVAGSSELLDKVIVEEQDEKGGGGYVKRKTDTKLVLFADGLIQVDSFDEKKGADGILVSNSVPLKEAMVQQQDIGDDEAEANSFSSHEAKSVNRKAKPQRSRGGLLFPFKFKPLFRVSFKKKAATTWQKWRKS